MDKSVLVVVVNYGLASRIERLLENGALDDAQVLLVDNASDPQRVRELAERFGTQLLLLDRNYGFAGAVNRAVSQAGAHEEILLLNPDVEISASQLRVLHSARSHARLTGVSPILLNTDGTVQVGTAGGALTW